MVDVKFKKYTESGIDLRPRTRFWSVLFGTRGWPFPAESAKRIAEVRAMFNLWSEFLFGPRPPRGPEDREVVAEVFIFSTIRSHA